MVKINGIQKFPQLPYEFIVDGTEEFNKGTFNIVNQLQQTPYPDYSEVVISINNIDYTFIQESDLPNRVAKDSTVHPFSLVEPITALKDIQIPDRAFSTHNGVQTTWKYQLETIIDTSELDYTVDTETLALLDTTATNIIYNGSFLSFLIIAFRAVDAIPSLNGTVISHNPLNKRNNDISSTVEDLLTSDEVLRRRYEANINDYASSTYSKIKNGAFEEIEAIGETYFPSKGNYVVVRSSDNKYSDNTAQIQFNGGIRRITKASINLAVVQSDQTYQGLFGSTSGDVPLVGGYGDRYQCEEDGYVSTNSGLTFNTGDTAVYVYDKWYKNTLVTDTLYKDIDVTAWIYVKEAFDKLKISTSQSELVSGKFQNNTLYYDDGGDTLENIGNEYNLGFFWDKDTTYEGLINTLEETYKLGIGNITYNKLRYAQWNFKLIPSRDIDTDIERHTSKRVTKKIVKTNQQQESRVEMGKFGKANYQYVNRMGNDRFEITLRYFETDTYSQGLLTYDDMFELFDYYNQYKITKIKYIVGDSSIDVTYSFVANQTNLNPNTAFTNPVSPFTIQDQLEANTCYVRKHYVVFGDARDDTDLNSSVKLLLWNRFDYNSAFDKPLYTAVYDSLTATYKNDSDVDVNVDIALPIQRAIEGRGFTLNTQFNSKTIAGSKIVATGIANLAHKLTPINYTNEYGEVDTCTMHYCNDVDITPEDYPIADSYTQIFSESIDVELQPNERLGITQRIECITDRENLFIYRPYLENNSLIKEIGEGVTLKVYYFSNPILTTETKTFPSTTGYAVTVGTYSLTVNPPSNGLSYVIADELTDDMYFAYNNYGIELTTISLSIQKYNPLISSKVNSLISATATNIANLLGSVVIIKTKNFYDISAEAVNVSSFSGYANLVASKYLYDIAASATGLANFSGSAVIIKTSDSYIISAEAIDVAELSGSVVLTKTKDLNNISATATDIANVSGSVIVTMPYILKITATNIANITGNIEYTYKQLTWVEVADTTETPNTTCSVLADIGNIDNVEAISCAYQTSGDSYLSGVDLTSSFIPTCSDGSEYTLCSYNGFTWTCRDYVGVLSVETTSYECKLV